MATVYSSEVSAGTYNRIRLKVDYSGASATCTVQFRRTSSYSATWASSSSQLTFNGATKNASYSYSGTVGTSWVDLVTVSGYSISTSGGTYNWNFTQGGGLLYGSGTVDIQSQTAANGLKATFISHTWNTVTASASVDSWNGTGSGLQFVLNSASNNFDEPRRAYAVATTGTSGSKTATNSNYTWQYDSTFVLKGCVNYYLSAWCKNTASAVSTYFDTTARHLPPAPLQTLSVSQSTSDTSSTVSATLTIVGGSSSNNRTTTVLTQYRWKKTTDPDSTYTSWTDISWKNAWETQTATIQVPYATEITVQARQRYYQEYSEVKTTTFTSTSPVAPSGGTISSTGTTWNTVDLSASVSSFGTPSSVDGRRLAIGVSETASSFEVKREEQVLNVSSATVTVTNASIHPSATAITLKGCKTVYPYLWAWNGVASMTLRSNTAVYLAPAPVTLALTADSHQPNINVSIMGGDSTKNENVNVDTEYRYSVDGGSYTAWTTIGNADTPWTEKTATIVATSGAEVTVQARQVYQNVYSEVSTASETVIGATAPTNIVLSNPQSGEDWVKVTIDTTQTDWGSGSARNIWVGVAESDSAVFDQTTPITYRTLSLASSSYTFDSSYPGNDVQDVTVISNSRYYLGAKADNGDAKAQTGDEESTGVAPNAWIEIYTLPEPALITLVSQTLDGQTGSITATMEAFQAGVGRVGGALTIEYSYSLDDGTTWSSWTSLTADTVLQQFPLTGLPFDTKVSIRTRTTSSHGTSGVFTMSFYTDEASALIEDFSWSFDELRRNTITWRIEVISALTDAKNATLTIKNHTINLMSSQTALVATVDESLPTYYTPNETLAYSVTLSVPNTQLTQTITGQITMPRPILGLAIDQNGVKRYITDAVKAGGQSATDDFNFDARYDKFKIV